VLMNVSALEGEFQVPSPRKKLPEPGVPVALSIPTATFVCDIYLIS